MLPCGKEHRIGSNRGVKIEDVTILIQPGNEYITFTHGRECRFNRACAGTDSLRIGHGRYFVIPGIFPEGHSISRAGLGVRIGCGIRNHRAAGRAAAALPGERDGFAQRWDSHSGDDSSGLTAADAAVRREGPFCIITDQNSRAIQLIDCRSTGIS